jgi:hypothetical protein
MAAHSERLHQNAKKRMAEWPCASSAGVPAGGSPGDQ